MSFKIRLIEERDNPLISGVIKRSLEEHGVARPGTVYTDPTTDNLFSLFQEKGSIYYVVEKEGVVVGGCGVFPTKGLPENCAELVKLYVNSESRGSGLGFQLLEKCAQSARDMGYKSLYLETLPELDRAVSLYLRSGYKNLTHPLGDSGHFACSIWMLKEL